jgi:hypothetical protein
MFNWLFKKKEPKEPAHVHEWDILRVARGKASYRTGAGKDFVVTLIHRKCKTCGINYYTKVDGDNVIEVPFDVFVHWYSNSQPLVIDENIKC